MQTFALIGKPLGHSLSSALFRHWFRQHGIKAEYRALETDEGDLVKVLKDISVGALAGANVTIPYKETVAGKISTLDNAAKAIGAVNVIVRSGSGLKGLNTDGLGFGKCLDDLTLEGVENSGTACVFGSGGAARAVVHALIGRGFKDLRIVGRNQAALARIAKLGPGIKVFPWDQAPSATDGAGLLVNATPLGMTGFPPFPRIPLKAVRGGIALDLVYNPSRTGFLDLTGAGGFRTANGFGMLLHQAAFAFNAWFGFFPDCSGLGQERLADAQGGERL